MLRVDGRDCDHEQLGARLADLVARAGRDADCEQARVQPPGQQCRLEERLSSSTLAGCVGTADNLGPVARAEGWRGGAIRKVAGALARANPDAVAKAVASAARTNAAAIPVAWARSGFSAAVALR